MCINTRERFHILFHLFSHQQTYCPQIEIQKTDGEQWMDIEDFWKRDYEKNEKSVSSLVCVCC